jgi:hypothetical protein
LWQLKQVTLELCGLYDGEVCVYGLTGSHAVVVWHASHERVVTKWPVGLPLALVPLWQEAQVPATTPVWLNVAGSQAVVRWQLSHEAVVTMWFAL